MNGVAVRCTSWRVRSICYLGHHFILFSIFDDNIIILIKMESYSIRVIIIYFK